MGFPAVSPNQGLSRNRGNSFHQRLEPPMALKGHLTAKRNADYEVECIKVARLQSEFCTIFVFELRVSYEKRSEMFPEIFEPLFCGWEKILQNSRQISR